MRVIVHNIVNGKKKHMYVCTERCPLWYCSDAGVGRLSEVLNLDSNGSDNAVEMEPMEKFGTGSQRDNSPLVPPVPLHRQERRPQCRSVWTEWIPDGHRGFHQRYTKGLHSIRALRFSLDRSDPRKLESTLARQDKEEIL